MEEHYLACQTYLDADGGEDCICKYLDLHSEIDVDTAYSKLIEELEEMSLHLQVDGAHLNNPQSAEILFRKADGVDAAINVVRRHLSV